MVFNLVRGGFGVRDFSRYGNMLRVHSKDLVREMRKRKVDIPIGMGVIPEIASDRGVRADELSNAWICNNRRLIVSS